MNPIALGIRPAQIENPMDSLGRVITLRHLIEQGQMGRQQLEMQGLQLEQQKQAIADDRAARDVYKKNIGPDGALNQADTVRDLYGISPKLGAAAQTQFHKMQVESLENKIKQSELYGKQAERLGSLAGSVTDERSFHSAIGAALQEGVLPKDAAMQLLGQPWNEQTAAQMKQFAQQAMSSKDQHLAKMAELDKKLQEIRDTETRRHNLTTEGLTESGQKETGRHNLAAEKLTEQGQKVTVRGQDLSAATQRRGQDISASTAVRGQNMADTRARELNQITRDNKPPTEGEKNTLAFYLRAKDAAQTLESMEPSMAGKGLGGQARYSYAPNVLQSEENQVYRVAQRAFTEARLRKDSGAAIPPSEFENDSKTYFPQPGDTKATLQRKKVAREQVLRGLRIGAGRAMREIGEEPGDMPKATSMVKLKAPDGSVREVPADQAEHYISRGAKRVE